VIRIPDQCDEVESPALFLSSIPSHWGHFLTEGTSRLWALDQFGELADYQMFYVGPPRHNSVITSFLRLAQIDPRGLTALQRPTRFRKCFVPFPSFSNRACAYTNHANLGKKVAEEALNRGASNKSDQPVYLSRRRWRPGIVRMLRNEDILEERLANHGVRIVYPERLSLEDQIKLLNSHRTFIGCWGSAFHSLILSSHPGKTTTHVICQEPNANLLMFDAILGTSATYLKALSDTPDVSQQWPQLDQQIDVQLVLDYLRCTQMI
jgi:capsular polysaccharide biosynthesis protein